MTSLSLLFVIKSVDFQGGGAERVLADVAGELSRRGHTVTVMTADRDGGRSFYNYPESVEIVRYGIGRVDRPTGLVEMIRRAAEFRAVARRRRPDVAIGFMHSTYLPLGAALFGTGVPVVASEHIVYGHYARRPVQQFALGFIPLIISEMTVISEEIRDGFPKELRRVITVIPNPVSAARSMDAPVQRRRRILAVGRLFEQKDHKTLVAAFARVSPKFPEWTLRIVGDGPMRETLEGMVSQLGLSDRVELSGVVREVSLEYETASIFAMPSLYESFGLATAEALAHALPAIGFADCEGTNSLIADGVNGLLVSGGDRIGSLADGLNRLMGLEELREKLGHAGPESVLRFSVSSVCDRWERLLWEVVHRNKGQGLQL